jgi:hypothetical protein
MGQDLFERSSQSRCGRGGGGPVAASGGATLPGERFLRGAGAGLHDAAGSVSARPCGRKGRSPREPHKDWLLGLVVQESDQEQATADSG